MHTMLFIDLRGMLPQGNISFEMASGGYIFDCNC